MYYVIDVFITGRSHVALKVPLVHMHEECVRDTSANGLPQIRRERDLTRERKSNINMKFLGRLARRPLVYKKTMGRLARRPKNCLFMVGVRS